MDDNLDDFLPLRVTSINADSKRNFDEHDKQRLIEACLQPGVSIAGMALKAGVNANVLWRWARKGNARKASGSAFDECRREPAVCIRPGGGNHERWHHGCSAAAGAAPGTAHICRP